MWGDIAAEILSPSQIAKSLQESLGFLEINNSEYLWILSDDDILQHNSLKVVLNIRNDL